MPHEEVEWWNFNLPHDQRTATCPDFLLNAGEKDKRLIGSWDTDYERRTWDEVTKLVAQNRIDLFSRMPSTLRRYREYVYNLQKTHGSIIKYIQHHLLHWPTLTPLGPPFTHPSDLKILFNDWPYGLDDQIVHLVVWTKFPLAEDDTTGDLTAEARGQVQEYVDQTFGSHMSNDRVVWFKNWKSLKSVHAVEHFHVMLFDPDMDFVKRITGGHVPMCEKLRKGKSVEV